MAVHSAKIFWRRGESSFLDGRYSRSHAWAFDGGTEVPASSSPHVVPLPYSVEAAVDPEEAFVASLSSCHMLWFLSISAKAGFTVESYEDSAEGRMGRDAAGKTVMAEVVFRPRVRFAGGKLPSADEMAHLHHRAHEACFLANSVKTQIRVEPQG